MNLEQINDQLIAITGLLQQIAIGNGSQRMEHLRQFDLYNQWIGVQREKINELQEAVHADKQASYDRGYNDGLAIGTTRIRNYAYKLRKQGLTENAALLLTAAKVIAEEAD